MPKAVLQKVRFNINIPRAGAAILLRRELAVQTDLGAIGAELVRIPAQLVPVTNAGTALNALLPQWLRNIITANVIINGNRVIV